MTSYSPILNFFLIFGITLSILRKNAAIFFFTALIAILVKCDLVNWLEQWTPPRENVIYEKRQNLKLISRGYLGHLEQDPDLVVFFADLLPWRDEDVDQFDIVINQVNELVSGSLLLTYSEVIASFETWTSSLSCLSNYDKEKIKSQFRAIILPYRN